MVDRLGPSRSRIVKTLIEQDIPKENIKDVASMDEAIGLFSTFSPNIVFSDLKIKGGVGNDLFKKFRTDSEHGEVGICVMITSVTSHAVVSQVVEDKIDGFILKPFDKDSFTSILFTAIETRIFPSAYKLLMDEGILLLEKGKITDAREKFTQAKDLNDTPSLAHYYLGQCFLFEEKHSLAEREFMKGLQLNPINRHCLSGLYLLFYDKKEYDRAYEIAQKVATYFPGNPGRLADVVRLAVTIEKYQDIESYFDIYKSLGKKGIKILDYICAGLYVSGKHFLREELTDDGMRMFDKLTTIFQGKTKYLKSIIETLFDYELSDEAKKFLGFFPSFTKDSAEYKNCSFLANNIVNPNEEGLKEGIKLLSDSPENSFLYKALIKGYYEIGNDEKGLLFLSQAKEKWPDRKGDFNRIKNQVASKKLQSA